MLKCTKLERITFGWDYTSWPIFSSTTGSDPYPDIRSQISPDLANALAQWAEEMCEAYADETGLVRPSPSTAAKLDNKFDELTSRLLAEGIDVEQDARWWHS